MYYVLEFYKEISHAHILQLYMNDESHGLEASKSRKNIVPLIN